MANVALTKDGQVYLHVYGGNTSTTVTIRPDGQLSANQSTHESEPVLDHQSGFYYFSEKPSLMMPVPDELARSYVASARAATLPNK
jgi:hypothetical protein